MPGWNELYDQTGSDAQDMKVEVLKVSPLAGMGFGLVHCVRTGSWLIVYIWMYGRARFGTEHGVRYVGGGSSVRMTIANDQALARNNVRCDD